MAKGHRNILWTVVLSQGRRHALELILILNEVRLLESSNTRQREECGEIYEEQNKLDSEHAFENQNLIEMWPMPVAPTQRGHKVREYKRSIIEG